jgi:sulfate transport system ATP-binding protein
MSIEVTNITKRFGAFTALNDVSLLIPTGELVALLGPSGSGKTTLLRIIAGLEHQDVGAVTFHGEDASNVHTRDRNVGFVFQHYALFRHMTVFENIAFGLRVRPRIRRPDNAEITARVTKLLNLVQLENLATRYPSQLSGGQRQRVALARALAVEPKVLLLDEPFGALDAKVRKELRAWLRRLHDEISVTSVFVTHDQEEALEVSDRVVVMNGGKIEQVGTPEEVYAKPATSFVYNFLGNVNIFHGRVADGKVHFGDMELPLPQVDASARANGDKASVFVRPHLLDLTMSAPANGANNFKARIAYINAAGPLVRIELTQENGAANGDAREGILVELTQDRYRELNIKKGDDVFVTPKEMKVFTDDYTI